MRPEQIVILSFIVCSVIAMPFLVYGMFRWMTFPPPPPPFEDWVKWSEEERKAYERLLRGRRK